MPKDDSDSIWERFCDSTDKILELKSHTDPELKEEFAERVKRKESIISRAQTVADSTDWATASGVLKELQVEWKEVGRIGRKDFQLWKDFREVCDDSFARRRDQYEILEQVRLNNLAEKNIVLSQAQDLAEREPSDEVRREIKLLRQTWKDIGPVPRQDSDRIWKMFNRACDKVFQTQDAE